MAARGGNGGEDDTRGDDGAAAAAAPAAEQARQGELRAWARVRGQGGAERGEVNAARAGRFACLVQCRPQQEKTLAPLSPTVTQALRKKQARARRMKCRNIAASAGYRRAVMHSAA